MLRTNELGNHTFNPVDPRADHIEHIILLLRSLDHSTFHVTLGLVFNQGMLFDLNNMADWETIHKQKLAQTTKDRK